MKSPLLVATSLSIALFSVTASAQQGSGVTERVYSSAGLAPSRTVEQRTESGGRQTVVLTTEVSGPDGRWVAVEEIATETSRDRNGTERTRRDVFGFDADRRRVLREATDTTAEPSINGIARSVEDTRVVDINGGLSLAARRIEVLDTVDSDVRQTTTTLLTRGTEGSLRETERTASVEPQVDRSLVRHETTRSLRDANGRWMPIASQSADVRSTGPVERVEEETVQRPDVNGHLTTSERIVTRRSGSNGQEQVTIERYSQNAEGFARSGDRLALEERIHRSTTATSNGHSTVEEVEARNRVSPGDPMRIVRRTVATVRRVAPDRQAIERQVFELDVNGRLTLVATEQAEASSR
jgi:hypothetical protein